MPDHDMVSTLTLTKSHQRQQQEVVKSSSVIPQMKKGIPSIIDPDLSPKHYRVKKKKSIQIRGSGEKIV